MVDARTADPGTGLIQAYLFDGAGGAVRTDAAGVERWKPGGGALWVHMDLSVKASGAWLASAAELDPWVVEGLTDPGSRPRAVAFGRGALVVLRGPDLNPGANPARMIPLAIWADGDRLITLRQHAMRSITAMRESLEAGGGPETIAAALRFLLEQLEERSSVIAGDLSSQLESLADCEEPGPGEIERLAGLRHDIARMRRVLVPQRDAARSLADKSAGGVNGVSALSGWIGRDDAAWLNESASGYAGLADELEALREEATLIHEEWAQRAAQRTESRLYLLAVLTAVFLPLTLVTGMLGMNVGGVPWAAWTGGFWAVTIALVLAAVGGLVAAKWKRWL